MNKMCSALLMLSCIPLLFAGCGGGGDESQEKVVTVVNRATAYIEAKSGSELVGKAIFINEDPVVAMMIMVENAPPGIHAVHLHETGDCSDPEGKSAGGHWNPTQDDHGKWGEGAHHLGDIGNLIVADDGTGSLEMSSDRWTMGGGEANDIMGKAVIIHAGEDDFTTQPTGAAGGRIGCGVIGN